MRAPTRRPSCSSATAPPARAMCTRRMVFAAAFDAPIVFYCQNNQWAISEPVARQSRVPLWERSTGYGFPGVRVDGNDVLACLAVTGWALDECRSGNGPVMIEAFTYRMDAHTTSDDPTRYRMAAEEEHWKLLDPIERVRAHLAREGLADQAFFDEVSAEADELAARFRGFCVQMPKPAPDRMFAHVYSRPARRRAGTATRARRVPGRVRGRTVTSDEPRCDHHPGQGTERGFAVGDGGRPEGHRDGRGRRPAGRRLPGHRRPAEGLRRPPGAGHPAGRVRHRRHRSRSGHARLPAGGRDPVRRVRLPGVRPDHPRRSPRSPTGPRAPGRCRW